MSRKLDPGANLESLRKHAKNWLKALKAGDSVARERLAIVLRTPWEAGHRSAAARVAMRFPELARHSIHAAAAFGDFDEVKRRLAADPSSACAKGGPEDREPLQILAYARLPLPAVGDNALAIANLLLDHGADPNSEFLRAPA